MIRALVAALALVAAAAGCARRPADADARLSFVRPGQPPRSLDRTALVARVPPVTFEAYDPYYSRSKRYRALPLRAVLEAGFDRADEAEHYVLRARDGYTVPLAGKRLLEEGAYLAVEDLDAPGWQPIGPQQANPGPFYLVWRHPHQHNLETHPRPWQLATVEIAPFEAVFPHTEPRGEPPDSAARRGYALFRDGCVRCHAINREGGRVGPDLNVPRSIVEYRPVEQIKAYIRDPLSFRHGAMPAHPHLGDGDLDDLVAYFHAMSRQKHDPDARR